MLNVVSNNTKQYDQLYTNGRSKSSENFEDCLTKAGNKTAPMQNNTAAYKAVIELQKEAGTYDPYNSNIQIPDSWATKGVAKSGVNAAEKFLRENGIDPENIVPSHNITSEQMEWLRSRHDLANMELHIDTQECQDLYGDLIVLGVCTFDEIMQLFAIQMPENGVLRQASPNDIGIGGLGIGTGASSLKGTFQYTFDTQKSILSAFMSSRGNKPLSALSDADQRFVQSVSDLLSKKQDIYDLLLGIFE